MVNKKDDSQNNKIIYDTMLDIHKHIFEQQKYAETKNNILLTITLALSAIYVRFFILLKDDISTNNFWLILFFIPLFLLFIALCLVLHSFSPNLNNKEVIENTSNDIEENIYFFKYLAQIESKKLLELITSKVGCQEFTNRPQIQDLANQICVLSRIALKKHNHFNDSIRWLKYSLFSVIALFCLYFLLTRIDYQEMLNALCLSIKGKELAQ